MTFNSLNISLGALELSLFGKYNAGLFTHTGSFMRILGLPILEAFKKDHAGSRSQLNAWQTDVEHEVWQTPNDIKDRYRSADFLADNRVIFNIKENSYRLVVKVRYQNGLVLVEWVGTHAEYSKKKF